MSANDFPFRIRTNCCDRSLHEYRRSASLIAREIDSPRMTLWGLMERHGFFLLERGPRMYTMPQHPAVILVIDDDPLTLTGTAATLDMAGYECHIAGDANSARKKARTLNLDLIICDVSIEGESGLELCRELRVENNNSDASLLFVSCHQAPDIIRRSHDAGGAYYLRKPFDPDVLIELVGTALWMPHLVQSRMQRIEPARPARPSGLGRSRSDSGVPGILH